MPEGIGYGKKKTPEQAARAKKNKAAAMHKLKGPARKGPSRSIGC